MHIRDNRRKHRIKHGCFGMKNILLSSSLLNQYGKIKRHTPYLQPSKLICFLREDTYTLPRQYNWLLQNKSKYSKYTRGHTFTFLKLSVENKPHRDGMSLKKHKIPSSRFYQFYNAKAASSNKGKYSITHWYTPVNSVAYWVTEDL